MLRRTLQTSNNHYYSNGSRDDEGLHHQLPLQLEDNKYRRSRSTPILRYATSLVLLLLCGGLTWFMASMGNGSPPRVRDEYLELEGDKRTNFSDWPLVHIVHTRFMQEQPALHALASARLRLFEVFCLPTMKHQSSQQFLWIIQTDPQLDAALVQRLQALLQPFPNFYLVLSNTNFRINRRYPGAWRGGAEAQALRNATILTGSRGLLEQAMAASESKHVLETRLDADDGLHVELVQHIQQRALAHFQKHQEIRWTYWCTRRHMEWHWMDRPEYAYGVLMGQKHNNLCITPGITVGFPVGTVESDVPIFAHDKIVVNLREMPPEQGCGASAALDCLQFLDTHIFEAIRSRTPTSAGMLHVDVTRDQLELATPFLTYMLWDTVHDLFRLNRQHIRWMNEYLTEHLIDIARDNLYGQCTSGHSCKEKAKVALQELIASRKNISTA